MLLANPLADPLFDPLRELIEEAGSLDEWETGTLPIHRSRANLWVEFEDLAHEAEPAVAWRRIVEGLEHGRVEELPTPEGFALPLRPYQLAGFRWLAFLWANRLGGVLATIVPADKKIVHGMTDAVLVPCVV